MIRYYFYTCYRLICLVGRLFANSPGDLGSIPGHVISKTLKMVLDTSLLTTQLLCVQWWGAPDRLWLRAALFVWVCSTTGYNTSDLRGRPTGFSPLPRGWVYHPVPGAPPKEEFRRGPRHFWNCLTHVCSGPATGP